MDSSIISKLEAGEFRDIYRLFSDYLRPLADLAKKSKKTDDYLKYQAKTSLSFINRSLSILSELLANASKLESNQILATELFNSYKLCLECLEVMLPLLDNPYIVHSHRIHMVHCLEEWSRYKEAEIEIVKILERFRGAGSKLAESKATILPDVNTSIGDSEFGSLLVEIFITLVRCTANNQSKDIEAYKRILGLVEEIRPWYRVLDDTEYEKKHKTLLMFMEKCALFLIAELTYFQEELSTAFCLTTLREFAISSIKDQVCKVKIKKAIEFLSLVSFCVKQHRQKLAPLLHLLQNNFHVRCNSHLGTGKFYSKLISDCGASIASQSMEKSLLFYYFDALKVLCQLLAEIINREMQQIITNDEAASVSQFCDIRDAFFQFCEIYFCYRSYSLEGKIFEIALAAFALSLKTEFDVRKSVHWIKDLIKSEWIHLDELQYLRASLDNIGSSLQRNMQLNEASKSMKLSCSASWTYVIHRCRMCTTEISYDINDDITDSFNKAIEKTILLIDAVHQYGHKKVKKIIMESFEDWSVAKSLFKGLPVPAPLVKKWVKMVCKSSRKVNIRVCGLHCLLSSSKKLSKITMGLLLEQEIDEYEKLSRVHPECDEYKKMQMEIINILMRKVYVTQDSRLQKAALMIKKARVLRVYGSVIMEDCIHCLGEAISLINETCGETRSHVILPCHQLAVAYCLRALCTQEVKSNSEQLRDDINAALKIWLDIFSRDHCSADDTCSVDVEYMMLLLYNAIDLLSSKCFLNFHQEMYSLIIKVFTRKHISLEKFVTIFWGSRRTSHGLCISPVNEAFLMSLSQHLGEPPKFINFWTHCLRESPAMLGRLQQNFFIFCENGILRPCSNENNENSFQLDMTVDEVKEAASKLISTVPVSDHSIFLAGSLYYSLCERHISNGHILQALCYAKDAYRLHDKLFQKKFIYTLKQKNEKNNEAAAVYEVYGSSLHEIWSFNNNSWDLEGYLSPWNVLQSYLESVLQVGIVHEIIGNSVEAERFLLCGKNISCIQGLPLFIASFSIILGKLYRKKHLWDLAENELHSVQKLLRESGHTLSCLNCKLMLEVTVDQHFGDFFQSNADVVNTSNIYLERLTRAEDFYRSTIDKLNLFTWENSVNNVEEESEKDYASVSTIHKDSQNADGGLRTKIETRNSRKAANARKASKKEQTIILDTNIKLGQIKQISSRCNNIKCWYSLCMEVMTSGLLDNFIKLKWEFIRRRLLVRVLIGIGTCLGNRDKVHEMHEIFLKGLSAITNKTLHDNANNSIQPSILVELIGKEIREDVFAVDRAKLLYTTSWFLLKSHPTDATRFICCHLSQVQFATLVSWLKLAFILSREVPTILHKVSRLLAIIHVASSLSDYFSLPSHNTFSESHWASFFHQASLGIHLNYQFHSNIIERCKGHDFDKDKGFYISSSTCIEEQTCCLLRTAPESTCDLEKFIMKFFEGLPSTTTICVTLLGKDYSSLLQDLLNFPSCVRAHMLLSRFNSKNQPLVIVLSVDALLQESAEEVDLRFDFDTLSGGKDWQCPWGFSVVDDVVPEFKMILKENYASSTLTSDNSERYRELWWGTKKNLDGRLQKLLRTIEDSWLGPWRIMLLGDWQPRSTLDSVCNKLVRELKSKAKIDVNESLLKVILAGSKDDVKVETFMSELCSKKGCYVSRGECCDEERRFGALHPASSAIRKTSALAIELIREAISQLKENTGNREPIILILDYEVQMLPWENVPVMRNQEVYRMPSVGSISMMFDRSKQQTQDNRISFPMIDPLDAFYLLNPDGDLRETQDEFENWFKDQHWEGKARSAPTAEELAVFLKSHDLFIYMGHGCGKQYIPRREIQKLKNCAASLLMGCSSGSLELNGSYAPEGTPLSYLKAGSPFIVANLWVVSDMDINRFGKAMLDAWLRERSNVSAGFCSQCELVSKELESFKSGSKDAKKKYSKKKRLEKCEANDGNCDHRPKIGSFMSQARVACTLQFLTGASPVCYGVPTGIWKKKGNDHIKR